MKILLLEDRITRQDNFIADSYNQIFQNFSELIDNRIGGDFSSIITLFKDGDYSILEEYECIILHRSALSKEIKTEIFNLCKKGNKALVYFSGGISSSFLDETLGFSFLTINSKDFYSKNLELFLLDVRDTGTVNLGLLAFGEHWELNQLLSLRQKLSLNPEITKLGDKTSVDEIKESYQITSEYLSNFFKAHLKWFDNGEEGINSIESINQLKATLSREVNKKLAFE